MAKRSLGANLELRANRAVDASLWLKPPIEQASRARAPASHGFGTTMNLFAIGHRVHRRETAVDRACGVRNYPIERALEGFLMSAMEIILRRGARIILQPAIPNITMAPVVTYPRQARIYSGSVTQL